ncbi:MAG: bacillithiol biosynthesis deacetylase BshB1 [Ignavibacteriae bacterium]|nr:MAG: bacillithiol biosynthesis deacetylase BshB1 [Ignavibacteriota bacterium]
MKLDVLFFAAHPDDIELCCGGTLLKLVRAGKFVGIADLTQGELSTRGTIDIRKQETCDAANVLGVPYRINLNMQDGNITNTENNRLKIIQVIRTCRPDIIFLPYPYDRHPDHIHASELIRDAAFYSGLSKIESEFENKKQEAHRPAKSVYFMQTYTFEPSFIVDITNEFDSKMNAILCYRSQFHNPESNEQETFISDKKYLDNIKARAEYYGFKIGVKFGEPFYMEETIKIDPLNLFN